jgi:hypothetical protein
VRTVLSIDRPVVGRDMADPMLARMESDLWALIRDDAAAAAKEVGHAPD